MRDMREGQRKELERAKIKSLSESESEGPVHCHLPTSGANAEKSSVGIGSWRHWPRFQPRRTPTLQLPYSVILVYSAVSINRQQKKIDIYGNGGNIP